MLFTATALWLIGFGGMVLGVEAFQYVGWTGVAIAGLWTGLRLRG